MPVWGTIPENGRVSYHHPLEEGLGPAIALSSGSATPVSYHHPLEEGLGQYPC